MGVAAVLAVTACSTRGPGKEGAANEEDAPPVAAVQALLLRGAASSYRRNDLQYSAGGVAINDQAKWAQYDKAGAEKFAEFKEWMKMEKIRLNARRAYGRISV